MISDKYGYKILPEKGLILKYYCGSFTLQDFIVCTTDTALDSLYDSSFSVINDFRDGMIFRDGKTVKLKSSGKGHKEEISAFLNAVKEGKESPVSFRSICLTTLTTFKILDSLYTGLPQQISLDV